MPAEIVTLVRLPISEAVDMLRQRHKITETFSEVRLEDEYLAFYFVHPSSQSDPVHSTSAAPRGEASVVRRNAPRQRRARKRRNRMRTHGWPIVAKIENARGQTAVVYKPFVDALSKPGLPKREQRATVREILRANGNKPSTASIEYFLTNTLEYMKKAGAEAIASDT